MRANLLARLHGHVIGAATDSESFSSSSSPPSSLTTKRRPRPRSSLLSAALPHTPQNGGQGAALRSPLGDEGRARHICTVGGLLGRRGEAVATLPSERERKKKRKRKKKERKEPGELRRKKRPHLIRTGRHRRCSASPRAPRADW